MLGKILPVLLALVGVGAGIGAGLMLRADPTEELEMQAAHPCGDPLHAPATPDGQPAAGPEQTAETETDKEYVKLNNQFVIPIVQENRVSALVVMSLSVEVQAGQKEAVYAREPKLRDGFLQVMFDHANQGGFRGAFTNSNAMDVLRRSLNEVAQRTMGDLVTDVLIMEIARQDV